MFDKKEKERVSIWELQADAVINDNNTIRTEKEAKDSDWVPKAFRGQETGNDTLPLGGTVPGPIPGAVCDNTALRVILVLPGNNRKSLDINSEGDVIGTEGTVTGKQEFASCKMVSSRHVFISHKDSGWYLTPLAENVALKGRNVNVGHQIKVVDGDIVEMGDCQLIIEIS